MVCRCTKSAGLRGCGKGFACVIYLLFPLLRPTQFWPFIRDIFNIETRSHNSKYISRLSKCHLNSNFMLTKNKRRKGVHVIFRCQHKFSVNTLCNTISIGKATCHFMRKLLKIFYLCLLVEPAEPACRDRNFPHN